jgi:hypothetical protein
MGKIDISSRANSGDISFSRESKDLRDGAKGRDVSSIILSGHRSLV